MGFLLIFLLSFSSFSENLEVSDFEVRIPDHAPSCALLKHRALEREKVIRELDHLKENEILRMNHLITNKLFMDKKIWEDASVPVFFAVEVSEGFQQVIERNGFENMVFSVKGAGFQWTSYPWQTPEDYSLTYDDAQGVIRGSYLIYLSELCSNSALSPSFRWISTEEQPLF